MTLRNHLKSVKDQKSETMQSYFTRVAQIKEQLEAIGDMGEEAEIVMTTLNGLPRDWESVIWRICSWRRLTKFRQLWEECVQEEERIATREENLNDNDDQALTVHTKGKNKRKSHDHPPRNTRGIKKSKKDFSNYESFTCHKLRHIAINCPMKAERVKRINIFQAHAVEYSDQEVEAKSKYKKDMIKAKRIIVESIKDYLIPQVSSRETPK